MRAERAKDVVSRSPRGERGLKLRLSYPMIADFESLPTRGAWIEILCSRCFPLCVSSLPTRGAWIEISDIYYRGSRLQSLPTRGAWIEM